MSILEGLLDIKIEKILKLLLKNNNELFHINKISTITKVPLSSTFRIINKLKKLNLIETITIGKIKLYKLSKNKKTNRLNKIL